MARTVADYSRPGLLRGVSAGPYGSFERLPPSRPVEDYSRPGLLRGVTAGLYGSFSRVVGVATNITSRSAARGSTTAVKLTSTALAVRAAFRATVLAGQGSFTAIAARNGFYGQSTAAKTALADLSSALGRPRADTSYFRSTVTTAAGRWLARSSSTAGKIRTVVDYSRPGLLRGVSMGQYGSFGGRGIQLLTTDIAARLALPGSTGTTKRMTVDLSGRATTIAAASLTKIGHGAIGGLFVPRATPTTAKTGLGDVAGTFSRGGTPTAAKFGLGDQAGRVNTLAAINFEIRSGRTVVQFSTVSLYLVPAQLYGEFVREGGAHTLMAVRFLGASSADKAGAFATYGRVPVTATTTGSKQFAGSVQARTRATGSTTAAKTKPADTAGLAHFAGSTSYLNIVGPTYDVRGRLLPITTTTFEHRGATAISARSLARGQTTYTATEQPRADILTRLGLFGSVDAVQVEIQKWRALFLGSATFAKTIASDTAGRASIRGQTEAAKQAAAEIIARIQWRSLISDRPPSTAGQRPVYPIVEGANFFDWRLDASSQLRQSWRVIVEDSAVEIIVE